MRPVGVEKRRSCRAIRQREGIARCPGVVGEPPVQPRINNVEEATRLRYAMRVATSFRSQCVQDDLLHRRHDVIVENAVQHASFDARVAIGNHARWAGMVELQVLDDGAAFQDRAA